MEIERKFLIKKEQLPKDLANYSFHKIEQGYLCTDPVVRIRRQDDEYYLTYKSKGLLSREEYNLPLTQESYEHLKPRADGIVISTKTMMDFFLPKLNSNPKNRQIPIFLRNGSEKMSLILLLITTAL